MFEQESKNDWTRDLQDGPVCCVHTFSMLLLRSILKATSEQDKKVMHYSAFIRRATLANQSTDPCIPELTYQLFHSFPVPFFPLTHDVTFFSLLTNVLLAGKKRNTSHKRTS